MKKGLSLLLVILMLSLTACGNSAPTDNGQPEESGGGARPDRPAAEPEDLRTDFVKLFDNGPIPAMNEESLWGYININGEWVIEPQFENARMFDSSGHAVINGGRDYSAISPIRFFYGYIDRSGEIVIPPQYHEAENFDEDGLAFVEFGAGGQWFINEKGEIVHDLSGFRLDTGFNSDGIAAAGLYGQDPTAADYEENHGFINKSGEWVGKVDYHDGPISSVSAAFDRAFIADSWGDASRYAMIDTDGNFLTEFVFAKAGTFSTNGLASVQDAESGLYGYIDTDGNLCTDFIYSEAGTFSANGLACVKDAESGLYGYIGADGEYAIPPRFVFARNFTAFDFIEGGLAPVTSDPGVLGYINSRGEYVIQPKYSFARPFNRYGYALVGEGEELNRTWKVIDTSGQEYESDGLQAYYFDQQGNVMIGDQAHFLTTGYLIALSQEGYTENHVHPDMLYEVVQRKADGHNAYGYTDLAGNIVINFQFSSAGPFSEDGSYARVASDEGFGIIGPTGEWLIPPEFAQIFPIGWYYGR